MWMEMGCFQRRGEEGSRVSELFLFKGAGGGRGNNSHFLPWSPHLWPSSQPPQLFLPWVCVRFFLFFCTMCVSLSGSRTPLYDWWASVRPGSLPRPRPDQACSGHNNAINMWLTAVPACVCACVCVMKHEKEGYHNSRGDALRGIAISCPSQGLKRNLFRYSSRHWLEFDSH